MAELYKSKEGKKEILDLYDQKLESLNIDYKYKNIETKFGNTNVIVTGNPENEPLIIIHGSNGNAPVGLESYPNLTKKYQVFAVDVLAQPNKSAETRLSMKDNSYGEWLNEVIDKLELKNVVLAGFSFGGLVILKTLIQNEKNIKSTFISCPVFIVNGNPLKAIFKMFIPMRRYMKTKKISYVEKIVENLFTDKDPYAIQYLSKVFLHFKMDFSALPVISKKEANAIKTPINLFAGGNDIMFPGKKMLKRAKKIFPSLGNTILLEKSKHVQNKKDNTLIESYILK